MSTTYERVTYREEGATRSRSVILRNPRDSSMLGAPTVVGVEVTKEDDEVIPAGAEDGERIWVLDLGLVRRRTPLVMDLKYGWLVPVGTESKV